MFRDITCIVIENAVVDHGFRHKLTFNRLSRDVRASRVSVVCEISNLLALVIWRTNYANQDKLVRIFVS